MVLKVSNRMFVSTLVVYPADCMADWELWLTAIAQHHQRLSYCMGLAKFKVWCLQDHEAEKSYIETL